VDEATHRLQQAPEPNHAQRLAERQAHAVAVLVRRSAVEATKRELRAKGLKPQHFAMREIVAMAEARLLVDAAHRAKLIAEARKVVDRWTAEGFFGKRASAAAHNFENYEQRGKACDARASVERNSCTEWSGEMIKGYARVSTDGQDLATQHELLKAAGAELVYSEKQCGVKTDRAALARCMRSLEPGDTVVVTKPDRRALLPTFGRAPYHRLFKFSAATGRKC
jgi:hypothetical protein